MMINLVIIEVIGNIFKRTYSIFVFNTARPDHIVLKKTFIKH